MLVERMDGRILNRDGFREQVDRNADPRKRADTGVGETPQPTDDGAGSDGQNTEETEVTAEVPYMDSISPETPSEQSNVTGNDCRGSRQKASRRRLPPMMERLVPRGIRPASVPLE